MLHPEKPGESIANQLDAVFMMAAACPDESDFVEDTPDWLALTTVHSCDGLELVSLLNWATKDRVVITRPALDTSTRLLRPVMDEETEGPAYRLLLNDMLDIPYQVLADDGQKHLLPVVKYDVHIATIALWGTNTDGEEIRSGDASTVFAYDQDIRQALGLPDLTHSFEITPELFTE